MEFTDFIREANEGPSSLIFSVHDELVVVKLNAAELVPNLPAELSDLGLVSFSNKFIHVADLDAGMNGA